MLDYDAPQQQVTFQDEYVLNETLIISTYGLYEYEKEWCVNLYVFLPQDNIRMENVKVWFSKSDKLVNDVRIPYYSVYFNDEVADKIKVEKAVRLLLTLNYDTILECEEQNKKELHEETENLFILQQ